MTTRSPTQVRAGLQTLMQATVQDEAAHRDWTYWATRPMAVPDEWDPDQHVTGDCSKGCQYLCRWDNTTDPMGRGFDAYGNSTTIWAHLEAISLQEAQVGDIVTFGVNGSSHAAMVYRVIRRNKKVVDLELWSFGHAGTPNFYFLSYERRSWHIGRLPVRPQTGRAPESVLSAKTGYQSWMHWRLGSGAWAGWGEQNPRVRPDVPSVPPLRWWRWLAAFNLRHSRPRRANPATATPVSATGAA